MREKIAPESVSDVPALSSISKRATIVDVARHAGVSTASVSKVLRDAHGTSPEMRERVQASMTALGYRPHRPARGMRGQTYTLGLLVSDIENPFFALLAGGIAELTKPRGYELLIAVGGTSASSQSEIMDSLIDQRMDGLVLVAPRVSDIELDRIAALVPIVVVGRHSSSQRFDSVAGDDRAGSALIVNHLVGLGHRRIAFVANRQESDYPELPERRREFGFLTAMRHHGLEDEAIILDGRWSQAGGREAAEVLRALPEAATAVHAGADVVAFGILSVLWDEGVPVPGALSVAGYDNTPTSAIGPVSLTSVDQSGHEAGKRAGALLMERIDGRMAPRHEVIEPRLVPRSTTAAPGFRPSPDASSGR